MICCLIGIAKNNCDKYDKKGNLSPPQIPNGCFLMSKTLGQNSLKTQVPQN